MPFGPTELDPTVLRLLLRRLGELESEAHGVTDTVLGHVPYAGPGIPDTTVTEVGTALVDAFSTLGDSVGQTRLAVAQAFPLHVAPPAEIDLRVLQLDAYDEVAR
jgi:hypothetical protein